MDLERALRSEGIWGQGVAKAVSDLGAESVSDLAWSFQSAGEVRAEAPLLEATFRMYASTFCSLVGTPPTDQVDFGGWAGVPDLAKHSASGTEVLRAWEQSMPHLYCDRRSANEEKQKLLHKELLSDLLSLASGRHGDTPVSWETLQLVAATVMRPGVSVVDGLRQTATERVVVAQVGTELSRAFGCSHDLKRAFTMSPPVGATNASNRPRQASRVSSAKEAKEALDSSRSRCSGATHGGSRRTHRADPRLPYWFGAVQAGSRPGQECFGP